MKDIYNVGDGKMLNQLTSQVQKFNPEITQEIIQNKLFIADQDKELCDGSWVTTARIFSGKNSLARKLAFMKDIKKHILSKIY